MADYQTGDAVAVRTKFVGPYTPLPGTDAYRQGLRFAEVLHDGTHHLVPADDIAPWPDAEHIARLEAVRAAAEALYLPPESTPYPRQYHELTALEDAVREALRVCRESR